VDAFFVVVVVKQKSKENLSNDGFQSNLLKVAFYYYNKIIGRF